MRDRSKQWPKILFITKNTSMDFFAIRETFSGKTASVQNFKNSSSPSIYDWCRATPMGGVDQHPLQDGLRIALTTQLLGFALKRSKISQWDPNVHKPKKTRKTLETLKKTKTIFLSLFKAVNTMIYHIHLTPLSNYPFNLVLHIHQFRPDLFCSWKKSNSMLVHIG